jgi:hypothetical protein
VRLRSADPMGKDACYMQICVRGNGENDARENTRQ